MDHLDVRIFKSLGVLSYDQDSCDFSRLNPWIIAKKLGANGRTVKLRMRKMQQCGFIDHFQIYPNFRFLGLNATAYGFEVGDVVRKYEVISDCSLSDGINEIHNFIGTKVCIEFTYSDARDESRKLELLRRLTRCDTALKIYDRFMPPTDITLSRTDWRIIKALRYNALMDLSEAAGTLGLTAKTVRRRFDRMARHNAVQIYPIVNPARLPNTITYVIQVFPPPERWNEVMGKVIRYLDHSCILTRLHPPGWGALYLIADTIAEAEDNLVKIRDIEGVRDATTLILKEVQDHSQWLDSTIDRKIEESVP